MIKSSLISAEHKAIFLKVFGSLKQKVIWKFEEPLEVPANVMISNWLPQNDIFAHPNIKLFISHGGLLSTTEAAFHALPVIGIPFFGDQKRNIESFVKAGWALRLDYANITEHSLRWTLNEMLSNNRYLKSRFYIYAYKTCLNKLMLPTIKISRSCTSSISSVS